MTLTLPLLRHPAMNQYIRWFSEIGIDDIPVVRGEECIARGIV